MLLFQRGLGLWVGASASYVLHRVWVQCAEEAFGLVLMTWDDLIIFLTGRKDVKVTGELIMALTLGDLDVMVGRWPAP